MPLPLLVCLICFRSKCGQNINGLLWDIDINKPCDQWELNVNKHLRNASHPRYKSLLRNKKIVFVGDSLTRFQYLNLIHFFHYNTWYETNNQLINLHLWDSVKNFHRGTNLRFGCHELCDCYRTTELPQYTRENRHYYDIEYNISVSFFAWWPGIIIRGNFMSTPISDIIKQQ